MMQGFPNVEERVMAKFIKTTIVIFAVNSSSSGNRMQ